MRLNRFAGSPVPDSALHGLHYSTHGQPVRPWKPGTAAGAILPRRVRAGDHAQGPGPVGADCRRNLPGHPAGLHLVTVSEPDPKALTSCTAPPMGSR